MSGLKRSLLLFLILVVQIASTPADVITLQA